jgi:surface antigen
LRRRPWQGGDPQADRHGVSGSCVTPLRDDCRMSVSERRRRYVARHYDTYLPPIGPSVPAEATWSAATAAWLHFAKGPWETPDRSTAEKGQCGAWPHDGCLERPSHPALLALESALRVCRCSFWGSAVRLFRRILSVLTLTTLGAASLVGPTEAHASAKPSHAVVKVAVKGDFMTTKVLDRAAEKCSLSVAAGHRHLTLPKIRTSNASRASWTWFVPSNAPSGTWTFTVNCVKGKSKHKGAAKVQVINRGDGTGPLIEPDSVRNPTGTLDGPGGRGASDGCRPVVFGGSGQECFPNDPFNFYSGPGFNAGDLVGECTWYAVGRRPDLAGITTRNANMWLSQAAGRVPEGTVPVVGAIAVRTAGQFGHVAYVTGILDNGNTLVVDDANEYYSHNIYHGQKYPASYFQGYIYGGSAGNGPAPGDLGSHPGVHDLLFIKTKNTGSGHVEIHSATAASGYQDGVHLVTWFSPVDADNGWFQMVGSDLFFIKTKNTGSGHVEIHSATAASGYQDGVHLVTWFSPGDADNGWFQMVGSDLFFIKTKNTGSGHVEIHSATAASGYQDGVHLVTWFSPGDADNGWFKMAGGDLYFIKTHQPGSGKVEMHSAAAASSYQDGLHSTTWFSPGDANNGWFGVAS